MSRRFAFAAVVLVALVAVGLAQAQSPNPTNDTAETYRAGGSVTAFCDKLCTASLTGKSPWLTIAAGGAYRYATTPAEMQDKLGPFAKPIVFGPLLVLVLLVGFKDTLLSWVGLFKAPLNAFAELLHVAGGLFAYLYLGDVATADPTSVQSLADVNTPTDAATSTVTFLLMAVVHTAVWIVFNSVEVAILLSPFPFVDLVLKTFRTALIGLISAAAAIHPVLGLLLALPIIALCLVIVPFAIRFTIVGWVFTKDVLKRIFGLRSYPERLTAFASWHLRGAPLFAYGVIRPGPNGLEFAYRRLGLLWRKAVPLPAEPFAVGRGTFHPYLVAQRGEKQAMVLRFPPRYNGHEEPLANQLGVVDIVDVSFTTSFKHTVRHVWDWFRGRRFA